VLVLPDGVPGRDVHAVRRALGPSPRIGTTSVRRRAELRSLFPGAVFVDLRGNVDTRLRKLDAGECDVLALAAAGVERLGLSARISAHLSTDICVPAPGQGIVAIEAAAGAPTELRTALAPLNDVDAETALVAERAVVRALGGGCQMPLGALATIDGQELSMVGLVASADGVTVIRALAYGTRGNPAAVGEKLADMLLERGAGRLLQG
jgi:hydroxymethylbilane synthase